MTMEATSSADTGGAPGASTSEGGSVADAIGKGNGGVVGEHGDDAADKTRARSKAGDAKDAKDAAVAKALYKARRGGHEVEYDGETLARLLSDDGDPHEFPGPGGKPARMTYAELIRNAQRGIGAENRMRAQAEKEQRFQASLELARKDPKARMAFMMAHLGIEDPDEFVIEQYEQLNQRRQQIAQLMKEGKGDEAYRLQQQIVQERMERKEYLDRVMQQRQQSTQQQQQAQQQHEGKVQAAFEKAGVPWTRETFEMAEQAHKRWAELEIPKTYGEIAEEVAKQHRDHFHKRLRGIPREKLLAELPEDWRRTMRELEAEAAKATKKEERAKPKEEETTERQAPKDDGISEAEYMRRQRSRS